MKSKSIVVLLTIIAVLLAGNLLVAASSTAWAQDRPERPERPERPVRPQPPDRPDRPFPGRNRCVGITAVGTTLYVVFEDGSVEKRQAD